MKKFVCTVCGYVYEGETAPEVCPVCKAPASKFKEQSGEKTWAAEHVVGLSLIHIYSGTASLREKSIKSRDIQVKMPSPKVIRNAFWLVTVRVLKSYEICKWQIE